MKFPIKQYSDVKNFSTDYFKNYLNAVNSLDYSQLSKVMDVLHKAYTKGNTVYVCGNGGSASIANHFVCDHLKGVQTDTDYLPKVFSLSNNIEVITALANDMDYADCFLYQLKTVAKRNDVLIVVSSSGDSENIVRAAEWGLKNNLTVIALTGFQGGRSAKLANINLHINANNYGIIEDIHQSLMHIIAQYLRQSKMQEKDIILNNF